MKACRKCGAGFSGLRCSVCYRKQQSDLQLQRLYGITLEDYERMLEEQDSVCAICREACPTGRRLAVDHDHETRVVRGLLCMLCNRAVGLLKDSPERAARAAAYLSGT